MADGLHLGDGVVLPTEAVTDTYAMLAKRGAGKTNAAAVMAEGMFDLGVPWVVLDPVGSWWGIRAAGEARAGLPVLVLGGEHGDLPLEPGAGALTADLLVNDNLSAVLDLTLMDDEDELPGFCTDFQRELFYRNREPRHVFYEEADVTLPQTPTRASTPMLRWGLKMLKLGRGRGLGASLITQRAASLNKSALAQVETLIALRTKWAGDRRVIADWMHSHEGDASILDQLGSLQPGEAFISSPNWLGDVRRMQFRRRATYDSGATPKVGEVRRPPGDLAQVDLGALRQAMAATIEQAEANDPELLQRRIRDLERQLADRGPGQAEAYLRGAMVGLQANLDNVAANLTNLAAEAGLASVYEPPAAAKEGGAVQPGPSAARPSPTPGDRTEPGSANTEGKKPAAPAGDAPRGPVGLNKAETAVLTAVLQLPGRPPAVIGFLSGYGANSKSFKNAVGSLRSKGLLAQGQPLTPLEGAEAALGEFQPLPSGQELRDWWLSRLGAAERMILRPLIEFYPTALSRERLGALAGYPPESKSFANAVGRLRSMGLCGRGEFRATDELMKALSA